MFQRQSDRQGQTPQKSNKIKLKKGLDFCKRGIFEDLPERLQWGGGARTQISETED